MGETAVAPKAASLVAEISKHPTSKTSQVTAHQANGEALSPVDIRPVSAKEIMRQLGQGRNDACLQAGKSAPAASMKHFAEKSHLPGDSQLIRKSVTLSPFS